jgi:fructan beta-fructosidase
MRNRGRVIACAFAPGSAPEFGLQVRAGAGERTVVGYDAAGEWLLVDRTTSGAVVFPPSPPAYTPALCGHGTTGW